MSSRLRSGALARESRGAAKRQQMQKNAEKRTVLLFARQCLAWWWLLGGRQRRRIVAVRLGCGDVDGACFGGARWQRQNAGAVGQLLLLLLLLAFVRGRHPVVWAIVGHESWVVPLFPFSCVVPGKGKRKPRNARGRSQTPRGGGKSCKEGKQGVNQTCWRIIVLDALSGMKIVGERLSCREWSTLLLWWGVLWLGRSAAK